MECMTRYGIACIFDLSALVDEVDLGLGRNVEFVVEEGVGSARSAEFGV